MSALSVLAKFSFLRFLLLLPREYVEDNDAPVATIKRGKLYIKKGVSDLQLLESLMHLGLHIILKHFDRPSKLIQQVWHLAADIVANWYIQALKGKQINTKIESIYSVYQRLIDTAALMKIDISTIGQLPQEQQKQILKQIAYSAGFGQIEFEEHEFDITEKQLKPLANLNELAEELRHASKQQLDIDDEVEFKFFYTYIPYILRYLEDYSYRKYNKRYLRIALVPAIEQPEMKVLIGLDVSLSMPHPELQQCLNFIANLLLNYPHVSVDVAQFSVKVTKIEHFTRDTLMKMSSIKLTGRGGTDYRDVFAIVDKNEYDAVVIFTDGYCDFPPRPRWEEKLVWCFTRFIKAPYGKSVVVA